VDALIHAKDRPLLIGRFLLFTLHPLRCAGAAGGTIFLGGIAESRLGRAILEKPFAAPDAAEPT